jgi:hypothetical protein
VHAIRLTLLLIIKNGASISSATTPIGENGKTSLFSPWPDTISFLNLLGLSTSAQEVGTLAISLISLSYHYFEAALELLGGCVHSDAMHPESIDSDKIVATLMGLRS